jgi:RNA polymerase sigma factor (sigma-70 family)
VWTPEEATVNTPSAHRQDLDLARRAAAGEEQAWHVLYEDTCQSLFSLLCFQVGDRDTARDLLQETYLTALDRLAQYRGEGSLLGWLRAIALRKSLDWKRSLWRHLKGRRALAAEPPDPAPDGRDARLEVESAAFREALRRLSDRQRAALLLRELEGLSFREIAATLNCNEATARVHHLRARSAMKQQLADLPELALADEMGGQQA